MAKTQEKEFKSGFVTVIGRPNVGKSTLMNHLIGQKIAITSAKPQTTRNRIQTVYTDERGQIIFLDTPGMNKAKNKLGDYMLNVATHTLNEVDLILWVVEPSTFIGSNEEFILERLNQVKRPVVLVINKIDTVEEGIVEAAKQAYCERCEFAEVVDVAALRSINTEKVLGIIFKYLKEGPMFYDEDTITDQPMRQIVAELIREKALRLLDKEIPHGIAVTVEEMKQRQNGMYDISATIVCERDSHKGIIIGKQGNMLKRIGAKSRIDMEKMLEEKVNLKLWVKVRKEWRDSDIMLKNYGYNKKEI